MSLSTNTPGKSYCKAPDLLTDCFQALFGYEGRWARRYHLKPLEKLLRYWNSDSKLCALLGLSAYRDRAAVFFGHNLIADRESHPGAFPNRLSSKERVKNAGLDFFAQSL